MSLCKYEKLNTGASIPTLGYGSWLSSPEDATSGVEHAMKVGYRHLDTAKCYMNQEGFGKGFKRGLEATGNIREQYFVTSKLWNTHHKPSLVPQALDDTLKELDLEYLDLFLIHWPVEFSTPGDTWHDLMPTAQDGTQSVVFETSLVETWKAMINLPKNKVKAVGVSNFTPSMIDGLIASTGVTPAVCQVERHPRNPQFDLLDYCRGKGIHVTNYSPLGNNVMGAPLLTEHDIIKRIAQNHSHNPGQVLLAWSLHGGNMSAIPKSVHFDRIELNYKQITLLDGDIEKINQIGEQEPKRYNVPANYDPVWKINIWDTPDEHGYPPVKVQ